MFSRFVLVVLSLLVTLQAGVPVPRDHLGFTPGDEKKLASYEELIGYFQKLAASSDRIRLERFGSTSTGKPMYIAFLSSADNLRKLSHYRDISRRLALGIPAQDEARRLAEQGKAIVWIDSGLHAIEVAPSQHAPELAYKMITDESEETRRIRQNVILLQVPCINPDGLDWVVDWYRQNVGTPYELAPLPRLYQKYSGHDNNRDWFMLNLPESRNVTRLLFQEWFPQIVYNQHQSPPFPSRIFVPPYSEPLNPNVPAAVMDGINQIGAAMRERFARSNQPGVLSYWGYDAWWNGGLRSVPAFHNMHGILTETAGFLYGNSRVYKSGDFPERFGNGMPTKEATVFYDQPWLGGKWGVREAIDYMLTADLAILELASARAAHFLYKAYEMARANIDANPQVAYLIPREQWDRTATESMLERIHSAGIRVERAAAPFESNGKTYPEGTRIIRAGQPFRGYIIDLFEPQRYPELRTGSAGPTKRPYDIAGWTVPMLMGAQVERVEGPLRARLEDDSFSGEDAEPSRDHRDTGFFLVMAKAIADHRTIRWSKDGRLLERDEREYGNGVFEFSGPPRVAVYEPWTANIDAGWTDWLLDHFQVQHTMIHNEDLRAGGLRARFDTIILASQAATSILHGIRSGERAPGRPGEDIPVVQRPEFSGGIELAGLAELDNFVRAGGTLMAFDAAAELPVQQFPLPLQLLLRPVGTIEGREVEPPADGYYCPGSVLRISVDSQDPIAFGMPREAFAFSTGGQAFEITLLPEFNKGDREVHTIARYATSNLLASGWISGQRAVLGRPILVEARHGQGNVLLFGFRPQFRGQTFGTFKFVLNAVYLGSAKRL
jgi:hypothetical protein